MTYEEAEKIILADLRAVAEDEYRHFNARVIYTVPEERVIGAKTGAQRDIAKKYFGTEVGEVFLAHLPHHYFEEYQVHSFMIERMKDRDRVMKELERILPYVDNWATCDCMSPKVFKKNPPEIEKIRAWMADDRTYIARFGNGMLMRYYLDDRFRPEFNDMVADMPWEKFSGAEKIAQGSDAYYINMMRAWYFATALAKQWEATVPYIEKRCLDIWTHNKAIQKACESYRVPEDRKAYLRSLKVKK